MDPFLWIRPPPPLGAQSCVALQYLLGSESVDSRDGALCRANLFDFPCRLCVAWAVWQPK